MSRYAILYATQGVTASRSAVRSLEFTRVPVLVADRSAVLFGAYCCITFAQEGVLEGLAGMLPSRSSSRTCCWESLGLRICACMRMWSVRWHFTLSVTPTSSSTLDIAPSS